MQFIDIATEQTTAATDAILAILALGAVLYLRHIGQRDRWKTNVWSWAFGLLALSTALGAVVHGFSLSAGFKQLLWRPLHLSLGLTIALFVVGVVYDAWGIATARRILPVMIFMGLAFWAVTQVISGGFVVFIFYEALTMLFALGVYSLLALRGRLRGAGLMMAGILVTLVAAGIQASQAVSIKVIWEFDHNGVFHLVQMFGVFLLVLGLRAGLTQEPTSPAT